MSESNMNRRLGKALVALDGQRVENRVGPGTPDWNFIEGWIECKHLDDWPKSADTRPVKLHHDLEPQQRAWLRIRWRRGGKCFVMLHIKHDWLLFTGDVAAEIIGHATRPVLFEKALATWNPLNDDELITLLSQYRHPKDCSSGGDESS